MTDTAIGIGRSRFGLSLPLVVGVAVFALMLLSNGMMLHDPDTYWHIVTGRWIIAHQAVPRVDIFSYSMAGRPWVAHEWLSEVVIAAVYDRFGWSGLVAVAALAFAAALAALTRALLRFLEPAHALFGTIAAAVLCLEHLLVRPHIFSLPLLVIWVGAMVDARRAGKAPALPWALLMTLWANLHGSYLMGLGLSALFGAEAVATAGSRRAAFAAARGWAVFGVASLAAALATPYGIAGPLVLIHLAQMPYTMSVLNEWRSQDFQHFGPFEGWLLVSILAALGYGVRLPWTRILMLLLLLALALAHVRQDDVLGLAAPLILAAPLAAEIARRGDRRTNSALDNIFAELAKPATTGGVAVAAAAALAFATLFQAHPITRGNDGITPADALAAVAADHVSGPVFNDYDFGGYLIFSGVRPFIDGRADMYGDAFMKRDFEAVHLASPELPQLLDEYHATWTLLSPKSPAVILLDHLPGWHRLFADAFAVVHVRDP